MKDVFVAAVSVDTLDDFDLAALWPLISACQKVSNNSHKSLRVALLCDEGFAKICLPRD